VCPSPITRTILQMDQTALENQSILRYFRKRSKNTNSDCHFRLGGKKVKDEEKTKDQLINELVELRRRFAEMEALEVRRKEAEDFVVVSKETILNSLMEHVIYQSTEMKILWANRSACESVDLTLEELVGRHCYEIWAQRTDPCPDCPVLKAIMTGQQQEVEKITPDGRVWFINGCPVRDSNGDVVGGIELTLDITERKLAEDTLKKSEARYRHIVEDQTEMICRFLPGGILTFVNDAYCRYFGKKREELIGRSFMSLIPEEDHVVVKKGLSVLTQDNPVATSEHQVILPNGEIGWQQWINRAIFNNEGKFIEYQSGGRDITKLKRTEEALQKSHLILEQRVKERTAELLMKNEQLMKEIGERGKAEEALRNSERQLADFINFLPDATFAIDLEGRVIVWNRAIEEMTGIKAKEMLGKGDLEYAIPFYGERRPILIDLVFKADEEIEEKYFFIHKEKDLLIAETGVPFVKGQNLFLWGKASPIYDSMRNVIGAIESVRDVTERKKVEDALRESENQLRFLSSQLLTVQEDERKRIAQELHDSIGQILTTVKFGVERAVNEVREVSAESIFAESLEHLVPVVQNGIEEVRTICADLWPSILDDFGILATISWFSREFQTIYPGIRIEKQIDVQENEVPDFLKIVIYRILQEALNNVAKHSKADIVCVSLKKIEDIIEVFIKDNGKGFDVEIKDVLSRNGSKRRLGLVSMKERTGHSGGSFDIESSGEVGTTVRASWRVEE